MAGPSETPYYVPPLVLSQAQQIYTHGVPVTEYYGEPELPSQRALGPTVPDERTGSQPTAYPTAAAPGGW